MTDPKKPSSSTSTSSLFAWLGRQVGYVSGAIRKPPKKQPVVAHREASVQEASPPDQPMSPFAEPSSTKSSSTLKKK